MRDQTFYSLSELNLRIGELCEELNGRTMRVYNKTRRALFEDIEKKELLRLPTSRFEWAQWKAAKVHIDYHVAFDGHYYSVPFSHVSEEVEVRATARTVEVFLRRTRIASHARSYRRGQHTTVSEHMPKSHREHAQWSPVRILGWAQTVGPQTAALAEEILHCRPHPEMGYRSCLGILRLGKRYGNERLEAACARARSVGAKSYRHVASVLEHGLDKVPVAVRLENTSLPPVSHDNVRGPDYYN
jgi:transposase